MKGVQLVSKAEGLQGDLMKVLLQLDVENSQAHNMCCINLSCSSSPLVCPIDLDVVAAAVEDVADQAKAESRQT